MPIKQNLNGIWNYRIGEGSFYEKKVPYSDLMVGISELKRFFRLDENQKNKRVFLCFDGITYSAEIFLNGKRLGEMLPYCEYKFEITDSATQGENEIRVIIRDIDVVFGPAEGWENYSGIIRDVYVEYKSQSFISDAFWKTEFDENFKNSECKIELEIDGFCEGLSAKYELLDSENKAIAKGEKGLSSKAQTLELSVLEPKLWSPENPYLYTLSVRLIKNGEKIDEYTHKVGFKKLYKSGKRFYLNGKPIFIKGVCRHDLFGDSGHTLTEAQMQLDMRLIKDMNANYVRLVHYPHNKRILEIADEIGLLVSEEPGLWWSDMSNPEIVSGSLEVLKRTVIRDRNHISVGFYLSFNECVFTPEYLKSAAAVCRALDDTRMVSGANCMDIPTTKQNFSECDLDFYTLHPYSMTVDRLINTAKELNDKPLLYTEWGGYFAAENERLLRDLINTIRILWNSEDSEPVLSGASFWCFAQMYEFTRPEPACFDGVQREGLVDIYRNILPGYHIYKEMFSRIDFMPDAPKSYVDILKPTIDEGEFIPISISEIIKTPEQNEAFLKMIEMQKAPIARFCTERRERKAAVGPIIPKEINNIGALPVSLSKRPVVLLENTKFSLDIPSSARAIHIIGNCSMPKGFPIDSVYGEPVYTLTVHYESGEREDIVMRNGKEITTAAVCFGPSRINPIAENAPRAISFINELGREHYIANMYSFSLSRKNPKRITLKSVSEGYAILLYGITAQK